MFITVSGITALVSAAINVVAVGYAGRAVARFTNEKWDDISVWYQTFKSEYANSNNAASASSKINQSEKVVEPFSR